MKEIVKRQTKQKVEIERVVRASSDHPAAETIYERVKATLPSISLGTVYRVLNGLKEEGKIREIALPDAPNRYDKTIKDHAHAVCVSCGGVYDVLTDREYIEKIIEATCEEFELQSTEMVFTGLCGKCREAEGDS